jgi:hypothetical protein
MDCSNLQHAETTSESPTDGSSMQCKLLRNMRFVVWDGHPRIPNGNCILGRLPLHHLNVGLHGNNVTEHTVTVKSGSAQDTS